MIIPLVAFYLTSRPMSNIGPSSHPCFVLEVPPLFRHCRHRPGRRRCRCGWVCVPGSLLLRDGVRFGTSSDIPGHRHARVACPTAITADVRESDRRSQRVRIGVMVDGNWSRRKRVVWQSHRQCREVIVNISMGRATSRESLRAGEKAKHMFSGALDTAR